MPETQEKQGSLSNAKLHTVGAVFFGVVALLFLRAGWINVRHAIAVRYRFQPAKCEIFSRTTEHTTGTRSSRRGLRSRSYTTTRYTFGPVSRGKAFSSDQKLEGPGQAQYVVGRAYPCSCNPDDPAECYLEIPDDLAGVIVPPIFAAIFLLLAVGNWRSRHDEAPVFGPPPADAQRPGRRSSQDDGTVEQVQNDSTALAAENAGESIDSP